MTDVPEDTLMQLLAESRSHPGRIASERWSSLQRIHKVMMSNEHHLLRFINAVESNQELALDIVQNVYVTDVRDSFADELIRLTHNYLSSLKMLVEHTRNIMRYYKGEPIARDYQRRVDELVQDGRASFLQKLRDYLIHYQIPPVGLEITFEKGTGGMHTTLYLLRDGALLYKDWSTKARTYLRCQPEKVPFVALITGYASDIEDLYRWLYRSFVQLHGSQIEDYNRLIVQLQGAKNTPGHQTTSHRSPERIGCVTRWRTFGLPCVLA